MSEVSYGSLFTGIESKFESIEKQRQTIKERKLSGLKSIEHLKRIHPKSSLRFWGERQKKIKGIKSELETLSGLETKLGVSEKALKEQKKSLEEKKSAGWKIRKKDKGYQFFKPAPPPPKYSDARGTGDFSVRVKWKTKTGEVKTFRGSASGLDRAIGQISERGGHILSVESLGGGRQYRTPEMKTTTGASFMMYEYKPEEIKTAEISEVKDVDIQEVGVTTGKEPTTIYGHIPSLDVGKHGIKVAIGDIDKKPKFTAIETSVRGQMSKIPDAFSQKYKPDDVWITPKKSKDWKWGDPSPYLEKHGYDPKDYDFTREIKKTKGNIELTETAIPNVETSLQIVTKNIKDIETQLMDVAKSKQDKWKFQGVANIFNKEEATAFLQEKLKKQKSTLSEYETALPKLKSSLIEMEEIKTSLTDYQTKGYTLDVKEGKYEIGLPKAVDVHKSVYAGKIGYKPPSTAEQVGALIFPPMGLAMSTKQVLADQKAHGVQMAMTGIIDSPFGLQTLWDVGASSVVGIWDKERAEAIKTAREEATARKSLELTVALKEGGIGAFTGKVLTSGAMMEGVYLTIAGMGMGKAFQVVGKGAGALGTWVSGGKKVGLLGFSGKVISKAPSIYFGVTIPVLVGADIGYTEAMQKGAGISKVGHYLTTFAFMGAGAKYGASKDLGISKAVKDWKMGRYNVHRDMAWKVKKSMFKASASRTIGKISYSVGKTIPETLKVVGKDVQVSYGDIKDSISTWKGHKTFLKGQRHISKYKFDKPVSSEQISRLKTIERQYGKLSDIPRSQPRLGYGMSMGEIARITPVGGWLRRPHVSTSFFQTTTGRYTVTGMGTTPYGKELTFTYESKGKLVDPELTTERGLGSSKINLKSQSYTVKTTGKALTFKETTIISKGELSKLTGVDIKKLDVFGKDMYGSMKGQTFVSMKGKIYTTTGTKPLSTFGVTTESKFLTGKTIKTGFGDWSKFGIKGKYTIGLASVPKGAKITTFESYSYTGDSLIPTGFSKGYVAGQFKGATKVDFLFGKTGVVTRGATVKHIGVSTYTRSGAFVSGKIHGGQIESGTIFDVSKSILGKTKPIKPVKTTGKIMGRSYYLSEQRLASLETGDIFEMKTTNLGKIDVSSVLHGEGIKAVGSKIPTRADAVYTGKTYGGALPKMYTGAETKLILTPLMIGAETKLKKASISISKTKQDTQVGTKQILGTGVKSALVLEPISDVVFGLGTKHVLDTKGGQKVIVETANIQDVDITSIQKQISMSAQKQVMATETVQEVMKFSVGKGKQPDIFTGMGFTIFKHEKITIQDQTRPPTPMLWDIPDVKPKKKTKAGRPRKRAYNLSKKRIALKTILADPFSVQTSQIRYGKATTPKITKEIWKEFERTGKVRTVEMREAEKKAKKDKIDFDYSVSKGGTAKGDKVTFDFNLIKKKKKKKKGGKK